MKLEDMIQGAHHLGIPVLDLKESVRWYMDKLGFQIIQQKLVLNPFKTEVAFLKLGDLILELFQPSGRELAELRQRKSGVMDHFAIDVPNLEECAAKASAQGMILHGSTSEGISNYEHLGENGVKGVNYAGPNGEVIEFCHDNSRLYGAKEGLQGWSHLAIKVRDLERTGDFYGALGFEETGKGYLDTPAGRLFIRFYSRKGFTFEAIQMTGAEEDAETRSGDGYIDHMAFEVKDVQEVYYAVRKRGFKMKDYVIKELPILENGVKFFTIFGPDGEKIEFLEKK